MSHLVTVRDMRGNRIGDFCFESHDMAEEYGTDILLYSRRAGSTSIVEVPEPPDSVYLRGTSDELGALSHLGHVPSDADLDRVIDSLILECDLDEEDNGLGN